MTEIACYVFGSEDKTVWQVYERCEHGIEEITPLWSPKYDLDNDEADTDQVPAVR